MPATPSEADIIFNKANVALAKSQRLIASWLPPRTAEELANAKSEEDIEKEEREMFAPIPELLGLGAPLPADIKDGDARRQDLASNDKLRRQLLGKGFQKLQGKGLSGSKSALGSGQLGSKPRPAPVKKRGLDSEDEDEAGRSSLGKSKRKKAGRRAEAADGDDEGEAQALDGGEDEIPRDSRPLKKARNYLDEVLAEKSRKKQKKKNKKRKREGEGEGEVAPGAIV